MRKVEVGEWGYTDYGELVESMEFDEILTEVNENNYQGSSFLLVREGYHYGLFIYGWGSCSGCDALQAASGEVEITELRDSLYRGIRWFDGARALDLYIESGDHELQWYGHSDDFQGFVKEARKKLGERMDLSEDELLEVRARLIDPGF